MYFQITNTIFYHRSKYTLTLALRVPWFQNLNILIGKLCYYILLVPNSHKIGTQHELLTSPTFL